MTKEAFITNLDNNILSSVLSANSIRSATDSALRTINAQTGNGNVFLSGAYTGFEDTVIDIEIDSDAIINPQVSEISQVSIGNGEMLNVSADPGAVQETVTVELKSLGTDDRLAQVEILGAIIRARLITTHAAGNNITIAVSKNNIVLSDTTFSLLEQLQQGKPDYIGTQFDFGAFPLTVDGCIDPDTIRLKFKGYPGVYRQYKEFINNQNVYNFSPAPRYVIPEATPIQQVTGFYDVTVTDGVTVENFSNIITMFDFLNAVNLSTLVEVVTPIADDCTPGGDGALDLDINTTSYFLPLSTSGSEFVTTLDNLSVDASSPTQLAKIKCINNDSVGSEIWDVNLSVDGVQENALTGELFNSPNLTFTVPRKSPSGNSEISGKYIPTSRDTLEVHPSVCVKPIVAGAKVTQGTFIFTYTRRPAKNNCTPCENLRGERPDSKCLGLDFNDGGTNMTLTAAHQAAREKIMSWYKSFIQTNRELTPEGELRTAINDSELATLIFNECDDALTEVFTSGQITWGAFQASFLYAEFDVIEPSTSNGFRYRANNTGTSGGSEPIFPTIIGQTVISGTVTLECISETPQEAFNSIITNIEVELTPLANIGANSDFTYDIVTLLFNSTPFAISAGQIVTISKIYWEDFVGYFIALNAGTVNGYEVGQLFHEMNRSLINLSVYTSPSGLRLKYFATQLQFTNEDIDNTANASIRPGISSQIADFSDKYLAQLNEVRIIAGLDPKGSANTGSNTTNHRCWRDIESDFWWESNDDYLPAFTNIGYHSVKTDADNNIFSTEEFFFTIVIDDACVSDLKEGDQVSITLGNISKAYQINDTFTLPIVHAEPVKLKGGVDGNSALVFSVKGEVTGDMPDYTVIDGAELDYNTNNLHFTIFRGAIPFVLSDFFRFSVEGGTFKWRIDEGPYTNNVPIVSTPISLISGISVNFVRGLNPSFNLLDSWTFDVKQPYALSHLTLPDRESFVSSGSGVQIIVDFQSVKDVDTLLIHSHNILSSATITLEGGNDGVIWTELENISWRENDIVHFIDIPWNVQYARLTITGSTDVSLKWLYIGEYFSISNCPNISKQNIYLFDVGAITSRFINSSVGFNISYVLLSSSDFEGLITRINYLKTNNDQSFFFVVNRDNTRDMSLVQLQNNTLTIEELRNFGLSNLDERRYDISFALSPVLI